MPARTFTFDSITYLTLFTLIHQLTHLIDELSVLSKLIFMVFQQILNIMVTKNANQTQQHTELLEGQDFLQIQQSLTTIQIAHPTKSPMQILLQVLHGVQVPIEFIDSNHLHNLEAYMEEVCQQYQHANPPLDYSGTLLPHLVALLPTQPNTP